MGRLKKTTEPPALSASGMPPPNGAVQKENYVERACAFIRARGGMGTVLCFDEHVVDRPRGSKISDAQWKAWIDYFALLGVPTRYAVKRGMISVPADWPEEFDTAALPSDREYRRPAKTQPYRGPVPDVAVRFQSMQRALAKNDPIPVRPQTPDEKLEELRKFNEANPIKDAPKRRNEEFEEIPW